MSLWGTRSWFEREFYISTEASDPWGHEWRGSQHLRYARLVGLIAAVVHEHSRLLDIGCAYGVLTARLSRLNPHGLSVGLDISTRAVNIARRRLPAACFAVSALPDCALAENQFDVVVAAEVICYLPAEARGAAIASIRRLLRPGGYLVFSNVLDNGTRYFTPAGAQALLGLYFHVDHVEYSYDRWYSQGENYLLDLERRLSRGARVLLDNDEYGEWCREHAGSVKARWIERLRAVSAARTGLVATFKLAQSCIRSLLSLQWPVRALARLSRAWGRDSARSTIFVVAKKEGRMNNATQSPN